MTKHNAPQWVYESDDPYAEGWDAREANFELDSNPYRYRIKPGDEEKYQLWLKGWLSWRDS